MPRRRAIDSGGRNPFRSESGIRKSISKRQVAESAKIDPFTAMPSSAGPTLKDSARRVFICDSRQDGTGAAHSLRDVLHRAGCDVWPGKEEIRRGSSWTERHQSGADRLRRADSGSHRSVLCTLRLGPRDSRIVSDKRGDLSLVSGGLNVTHERCNCSRATITARLPATDA
jgi:hypothetical protein